MTQGRSIRLFLVDGSPNGLLTAEIMNWTGHALTGPRSKLTELVQRPECGRTGIYFLIGPDPENTLRSLVYIGESDDVAKRLKQHNQPEAKGGKDFWEKVCLITSKDQNLTKSHAKFLESQLIDQATRSGRCGLINGTAPRYDMLPESDRADMAFFIEQIRTILPVLSFEFLREPSGIRVTQSGEVSPNSPLFDLEIPKYKIRAQAQENDGEFVVLKRSQARPRWIGGDHGYASLYDQLVKSGVLTDVINEERLFSRDHGFSSPSAAAAAIAGRVSNGRRKWIVASTGQMYGDWQSDLVSAQTPDTE